MHRTRNPFLFVQKQMDPGTSPGDENLGQVGGRYGQAEVHSNA